MRATIYNASAGSGKTYRLAYKYVRDVVEEPRRYRHILAVTFTNKATEEMKSRILSEIHALASGGKSNYLSALIEELGQDETTIRRNAREARALILHNYSRFTVLTIDTFFQRILRAFIQELGLDFGYNIELESSTVLEKSADELIEEIIPNEELRAWLMGFIEERVEEGKKWDIKDGILALGGELFKESNRESLENAHSKSELKDIMQRMEQRWAEAQREYRSAAEAAMEIIDGEGLLPSDFSGKSRSFAYIFPRVASGEIVAPTATMRKFSTTTEGWGLKNSVAITYGVALQPHLEKIIAIYDKHIKQWNTTSLIRENYRSFALLSDLYNKVKTMCASENMLLLSETKLILAEFIKENDAPFIYEKVGNRFDRYMIDEFQDTSLKEWGNFLPLLLNGMASSEENSVLIVGDVKQSIYRWRGGDWRILHSGAREGLGEQECETINMDDNFRSLPEIVEFNNRIISQVVESENTTLNELLAEAYTAEAIDADVVLELKDMISKAYEGHTQHPRKQAEARGYVEVSQFEEEPPIVERIKETIDRGFSPSDIMILTRSKSEGAKIASELLRFKGENREERYNFEIMTQEALMVGYAPVSGFITAVMRLSLNEQDSIERAIYNNFLQKEYINAPIAEQEIELFRTIRLLSPEEAFERIVMHYELGSSSEHTAYLQAIHEQIIAFTSNRIGDIALFLKWWDERGSKASLSFEGNDRAIEITTIHKAKGLEKSVVMIPYCSWPLEPLSSGRGMVVWAENENEGEELGRFPVRYKKSMGESIFSADYLRERIYSHIDNINLLYVALTRAVEALHIFIPTTRAKIGELILGAMPSQDTTNHFGEYSAPIARSARSKNIEQHCMELYPTSPTELKLRLPAERYTEGEEALTPRDMGILMHRAFEMAESEADIYAKIDSMLTGSTISAEEHTLLKGQIAQALKSELVKSWFSGEADSVRVESQIILPHSAGSLRPDRVMISGKRAVIVDYKFGALHRGEHLKQMRQYISLLTEMGYSPVLGYLWYIRSGEVVEVTLPLTL